MRSSSSPSIEVRLAQLAALRIKLADRIDRRRHCETKLSIPADTIACRAEEADLDRLEHLAEEVAIVTNRVLQKHNSRCRSLGLFHLAID